MKEGKIIKQIVIHKYNVYCVFFVILIYELI